MKMTVQLLNRKKADTTNSWVETRGHYLLWIGESRHYQLFRQTKGTITTNFSNGPGCSWLDCCSLLVKYEKFPCSYLNEECILSNNSSTFWKLWHRTTTLIFFMFIHIWSCDQSQRQCFWLFWLFWLFLLSHCFHLYGKTSGFLFWKCDIELPHHIMEYVEHQHHCIHNFCPFFK